MKEWNKEWFKIDHKITHPLQLTRHHSIYITLVVQFVDRVASVPLIKLHRVS